MEQLRKRSEILAGGEGGRDKQQDKEEEKEEEEEEEDGGYMGEILLPLLAATR